MEIFDAYASDIHSGSIIAKICHDNSDLNAKTDRFLALLEKDKEYTIQRTLEFAETVKQNRNALRDLLVDIKNNNESVYVYGAPAKGNTLLNYFDIDKTLVDKAVEINPMKIGHYLPQSHIPICQETKDDIPDYYLLLSHNFAKEIINKNQDIISQGVKFIIPFPKLEVIG
tara:strand:- start:8 stop:520 length:513 start_codon:yes stop_codon:yes gene_type:complete